MKLSDFKMYLQSQDKEIQFILPTGSKIPLQVHVTEIARLDKSFIDCGGTFRTESICRLQTWFSSDTEHRLTSAKLLGILKKSKTLFDSDSLDIEIEHEAPFISQFPISKIEEDEKFLTVLLGVKHTACLAEDKCLPSVVKANQSSCCEPASKCCS